MYWKLPLSARAQFALPLHFEKVKQSHSELVSFALVFLFFSYYVFTCTLVIFHLVKHTKRHPKCKGIFELLSCFYFRRSRRLINEPLRQVQFQLFFKKPN